jgi:predicted dehydrogenase
MIAGYGIADPTPGRRTTAAHHHPEAVLANRLDQLDPPADLVVIASPPAFHEADTRTALVRHHAHVLCEKPAVLDPETGRRLSTLATNSGLLLYPVHNYLHATAFRHMRTLISEGAIGRTTHLAIEITRSSAATGNNAWHPNWRTEAALGGGILGDHGTHAIYLTRHLAHADVIAVSSTTETGEHGAEHAATLNLLLADGTTATIALTWLGTTRRNRYTVHGTDGRLLLHDGTLELTTRQKTQAWSTDDPANGGHTHTAWTQRLHKDLLDHIHRQDPALTPWQTAIHVADVIEAARASALCGVEKSLQKPNP